MTELNVATPGDASVAMADDSAEYSLTLKQVPEIFAQRHRQVPSERSLQRYCSADAPPFKAKKIRTTYGQEWLVSEASLLTYIETLPIEAHPADNASAGPAAIGAVSDAGVATTRETLENATDDRDDGVASGERRTLAQVLIENARLVAAVEGRDQLIASMLDDKSFLREELREHRKNRDDIKSLANKMLETLEAMALGGRLLRNGAASDAGAAEVVRANVGADRPNATDNREAL